MSTTSPTKDKESKKQTSKKKVDGYKNRRQHKLMPPLSLMVCYRLKDPLTPDVTVPVYGIIKQDGSLHGELEYEDETIPNQKALYRINKGHPLFDKEVMQIVYRTYGFTKKK
jgi:hypothetical protein